MYLLINYGGIQNIEKKEEFKKQIKAHFLKYTFGELEIAIDPNVVGKDLIKSLLRRYYVLKDLTAIYFTMFLTFISIIILIFVTLKITQFNNVIDNNKNSIIEYISGNINYIKTPNIINDFNLLTGNNEIPITR